jgi:protein involved in polysaccharide export with SLBB domain
MQETEFVTAANSRRIYLIGEVIRPGAIPMLPNMTVLQQRTGPSAAVTSARNLARTVLLIRQEL